MSKFRYLNINKIGSLPASSGVYCFSAKGGKNNKEILYIGKAVNIKERVRNHFSRYYFKDSPFLNQLTLPGKIGYIQTDSEIGALILEANLIKKYQPKFNVMWRDDKNYFFVGITKEEFPQIFITHQKLKIENCKPSTRAKHGAGLVPHRPAVGRAGAGLKINYMGPFVDGRALKETLKILRKVFPYRSCQNIPRRPCLWYQLSRCPAPCQIKIKNLPHTVPPLAGLGIGQKLKINKIKNECQGNVKNIIKILQGKKNQVLSNLKKEMRKFSKSQNFEEAAKIRDQIMALEKVLSHYKVFENILELGPKENWHHAQKILQNIIDTKNKISRIEAYDVSNIQGQQATGSMVVFINGKPDKSQYRKFKIEIAGKPDDTAMLKEVLTRRFNHPEWPHPDLILIDGGIAQLNAALKIKNQISKIKNKIKVVSLAKKENELYIENRKKPILLKVLPRGIFNLILRLRDEAHRFALSYHRKLRKKSLIDS